MVPDPPCGAENARMDFDLGRVRENVRQATTEDLLDRATVYRTALEPAALPVVLEELRARGVSPEAVVAHEQARQGIVPAPDGAARKCSHCTRPAVTREWGFKDNDFERLNPNGSGISIGHPIGATGGRIMATLLHEMQRRDARYGLETMCIGGGQGIAAVIERV